VHLRKAQDPNAFASEPADLPYQQSTPLDLSSSKQDQEFHGRGLELLGLVCLRMGLKGCSVGRADPLAVSWKRWDLVPSLDALTVLAALHI